MLIRDLRKDDLPAIVELTQNMAMQPIDNLGSLTRATLEAFDSSAELCLVAEQKNKLHGFCFGALRESTGIIRLFGVNAQHRRQGIATSLLNELEHRLVDRGATRLVVDGIAPGWLFPGVELTRTPAIALLMERGYKTDRIARIDMAVDLTQKEMAQSVAPQLERLKNSGLVLRRALPKDKAALVAFVSNHFGAAWVSEAGAAFGRKPIPLFVALSGTEVVSFAVYDTTGPSRFGPTGTHPEMRGRGLGSTLMRMCMQDMAQRGDRQCEIVWVGPVSYYARTLNAQIHRAYWSFSKIPEAD